MTHAGINRYVLHYASIEDSTARTEDGRALTGLDGKPLVLDTTWQPYAHRMCEATVVAAPMGYDAALTLHGRSGFAHADGSESPATAEMLAGDEAAPGDTVWTEYLATEPGNNVGGNDQEGYTVVVPASMLLARRAADGSIRMMGGWVLTEPTEGAEAVTPSGIIYGLDLDRQAHHARVVAIGRPLPYQRGQAIAPGDVIIHKKGLDMPVTVDGKGYTVVRREYVAGVKDESGGLDLFLDWMLVRPDAGVAFTEGGVYIPEAHRPPISTGTVVDTGPGKLLRGCEARPGNHIRHNKYNNTDVVVNGESLVLVRESEVLLVKHEAAQGLVLTTSRRRKGGLPLGLEVDELHPVPSAN